MKTITARQANQRFSSLLAAAERGETVIISKRGKPVATLTPYSTEAEERTRALALSRALRLMRKGLPWPSDFAMPSREEMHER